MSVPPNRLGRRKLTTNARLIRPRPVLKFSNRWTIHERPPLVNTEAAAQLLGNGMTFKGRRPTKVERAAHDRAPRLARFFTRAEADHAREKTIGGKPVFTGSNPLASWQEGNSCS